MLQKLKSWLADDTLYFAALLLVASAASFGLGRQSILMSEDVKNVEKQASVSLSTPPPVPTAPTPLKTPEKPLSTTPTTAVQGVVVASKSGSKYHLPTCSGAKSIKPENLISFESIAAAQAAGYSAAANCPGLQ